MIPIGKKLRLNNQKSSKSSTSSTQNNVKLLTLDEQIALLEQGLENDNESDDDNSSDDNDNNSDNNIDSPLVQGDSNLIIEKDEKGNISRLVSNTFDRIEPLPPQYLPIPLPLSKRKKIDNNKDIDDKLKKKSKKKSNSNDTNNNDDTTADAQQQQQQRRSGLENTIREMLSNYQPLSGEKIPFYCRICRYQGSNILEFNNHRNSEEHNIAVKIELKLSYCKSCQKQLSSPAQLKEHLQARPHKERLYELKQKTGQAKKYS